MFEQCKYTRAYLIKKLACILPRSWGVRHYTKFWHSTSTG